MQSEQLIFLIFVFGLMMLLVQRVESRRRLVAAFFMVLFGVIVVRYINFRELHTEGQVGFVIALVLNGLFWLLIGRYNPVKSSDEMKVLGMDD